MKYRHELVFSFSDGDTEKSNHLSEKQIDDMIEYLQHYKGGSSNPLAEFNSGQRMRRRILSICYTLGWVVLDKEKGRHVVDMERLQGWMRKYSYLHKGLNEYSYQELPTVVTQFENLLKTSL